MDRLQKSEHDLELAKAKHDRLATLKGREKAERHKIAIPEGSFLKQPEGIKPPRTDKERIAELEAQVAELTKRLGV